MSAICYVWIFAGGISFVRGEGLELPTIFNIAIELSDAPKMFNDDWQNKHPHAYKLCKKYGIKYCMIGQEKGEHAITFILIGKRYKVIALKDGRLFVGPSFLTLKELMEKDNEEKEDVLHWK